MFNLQQNDLKVRLNDARICSAPVDVELRIELHSADQKKLQFYIHSRKTDFHHFNLGCIELKKQPLETFQAVYMKICQLSSRSNSDKLGDFAESQVSNLGNSLWDELVPEKLKNAFWEFKKKNVRSILITSDEPWIPWEMIKPYRYYQDGTREEAPFWCQQFALSRWLSGPATSEGVYAGFAQSVARQKTNLAFVEKELSFFGQLNTLHSGISVMDTIYNRDEFLQWIENKDFSFLHFACHGDFDSILPNESFIHLSNGRLCASDIKIRFNQIRPLVFMNACHGGRVDFCLTGLGGWAVKLIEARVGVFIGAMWEVTDKLALEFARCFYSQLLTQDITVAEAFRQAREEVRKLAPHDSTWLSYVLYAEPNIKLSTLDQENLSPINSLLCDLREAIEQDINLAEEDRNEALLQVELLELASQSAEDKKVVKTAIKILRGTIFTLPQDSFLYNFCNSELSKIAEFLGKI